jgi:hypothetical protein
MYGISKNTPLKVLTKNNNKRKHRKLKKTLYHQYLIYKFV